MRPCVAARGIDLFVSLRANLISETIAIVISHQFPPGGLAHRPAPTIFLECITTSIYSSIQLTRYSENPMTNELKIDPVSAADPEIGRWLWALEEVRKRTLRLISDLDERLLDWRGPDGAENSVGSLLYHIGLVEMSWLFYDLLQQEFPPEVEELFPTPMADDAGKVSQVVGVSLAEHQRKLARSREIALSYFQIMSLEEWRRLRPPVNVQPYETTPEWAVFHLVEHEAGHAFQISSLKARWNRSQD